MTVSRGYLLGNLKRILDYATRRALTRQTPSAKKIKWARIAVSATSAAGSILKDGENDEILARLTQLQAQLQ